MADSPLNRVLMELGETVETINEKVNAGKNKVSEYKKDIIGRLNDVLEQLKRLRQANINTLNSIPELKNNLSKAQTELQQKTDELAQTKNQLETSNRSLTELQNRLNNITQELETKNKELEAVRQELASEKNKTNDILKEKDAVIQKLDEEIKNLNEQKTQTETDLARARQEIDSLVDRLSKINDALVQKIKLIDTIAGEFGDNREVLQGFQSITDSIQAIMMMLNNPETISTSNSTASNTSSSNTPLYNKYKELPQGQKDMVIQKLYEIDSRLGDQIQDDLVGSDEKNQNGEIKRNNIQNILSRNPSVFNFVGGKRRRKTMKKRHRKTQKKMRGGYVYSSSKELDKASSVISSSSGTESASGSKPISSKHISSKHISSKSKKRNTTRHKTYK